MCFPYRTRRHKPENAKGGGQKRGGGGQNLMRRPPHRNQFPTPLTSVRFSPPYSISLCEPLRNYRNFAQATSSETSFQEGLEKGFPTGHPREVLLFGTFCPPPPFSSAQTKPIHAGNISLGINFCTNTCGACIRTRTNTGKYV